MDFASGTSARDILEDQDGRKRRRVGAEAGRSGMGPWALGPGPLRSLRFCWFRHNRRRSRGFLSIRQGSGTDRRDVPVLLKAVLGWRWGQLFE